MKNHELDKILRSVPAPERSPKYWDEFPSRVQSEIDRRANVAPAPGVLKTPHPVGDDLGSWWSRYPFRISFAAGLALACLTLLLSFPSWRGNSPMFSPGQVAAAEKYFREIQPLFPHQVRVIAFDRSGAQLVLSDRPDVPASPALYLRICAANQCRSFVTFSGQQIRFNGETCQVLVDRQGGVMVVGEQWVWSSSAAGNQAGPYRIAARPLPTT